MYYEELLDRLKGISACNGGLEDGLEELVRRYDIIEKQNEDARNGEYIVPDGYVLVNKYDLRRLMKMAWRHCEVCREKNCTRTMKQCINNHMLSDRLWEAYCEAFGMEDET